MSHCAVYGCYNSYRNGKKRVSFFRFPAEGAVRTRWIDACQRRDSFNADIARICSVHFEEDDFYRSLQQQLLNYSPKSSRKLKEDAVPSLYLPRCTSSTMPCCCAVGCKNRAENGFRLFPFPADPERKKIWIAKVRRNSWTPSPHSVLCQVHFTEEQFETQRQNGRRLLKQTAIPTVFSFPQHEISASSHASPKKSHHCVERGMVEDSKYQNNMSNLKEDIWSLKATVNEKLVHSLVKISF